MSDEPAKMSVWHFSRGVNGMSAPLTEIGAALPPSFGAELMSHGLTSLVAFYLTLETVHSNKQSRLVALGDPVLRSCEV